MNLTALNAIALRMATPGQGLLAADESTKTIEKRLNSVGVESSYESRRDWREMLLQTEDAMKSCISGVILYEETLRQEARDGTPLTQVILKNDALPGVKVDLGTHTLAAAPGETVTEGLDGLRERLRGYYALGARFAKWRATIFINREKGLPSSYALKTNMHALARYAALCQEAELVPIVEPEILMEGTHDIEQCYEVTKETLKCLYDELYEQRVALEGTVLKPNMILPGTSCSQQVSTEEIAEKTLSCLKTCVPSSVPAIAFLSGGQTDEEATGRLHAINQLGPLPWTVTFSYGRALQALPLKTWAGKESNVKAAQAAFAHRARMNSLAARGQWSSDLEQKAA